MLRSVLTIMILISVSYSAIASQTYGEVKQLYSSSEAVLFDRHGEVIHELRVDSTGRRLNWTGLADISPALIEAVIRSEDQRFNEHSGADWKALASAAVGNMLSGRKRGASTISMQLASLLNEKSRSNKGKRNFEQKWEQIKAARDLERTWSKDQILEVYLNLVSFRGELSGIAAASRGIFQKEPGGLDQGESCVLAALIRSPNAAPEKVGERAVLLASTLKVPTDGIKLLAIESLSKPYRVRKRIDLAPHAAQRLLRKGMTEARSTLDSSIQRYANEVLTQAVQGLFDQNVRDGAVLVADNKTGDVLAYVGNTGKFSSAEYVDGIRARRQAGSTLKPFLYGLAIDKRIITAATLIDDSPLDLSTERGVYRPENYDKEFRGRVTVRTALASSLNIPAVKTLGLVGTDRFVTKLRDFGFKDLSDGEQYGPSLALGSADVSLWNIVNAYRTLANGGIPGMLRLSAGDKPGSRERVMSREASYIVSSILSDREARSATFSLESPLSTRFWAAAKTGTSKDMRDNWCLGYSDRYTVGVWVGNFSGAPMWDVSGVSGAAPVWLEIMKYLHRDSPSNAPVAPAGIIALPVSFPESSVKGKPEFFIKGTEKNVVRPVAATVQPKIIYPSADMIIAIDPDIPQGQQKVFFETSSDDVEIQIILDGAVVGSAPVVPWTPVRGTHLLSMAMKNGSVIEEIKFEVR